MAIENIFGAPPEYLSGLLGVDPDKLRKQALTTGLVNTALAFAAQPRNQNYGSVLPYAARALMAGQQGAHGVYSGALQDFQTKQKIEELKRQQEQQQAQQQYVNQFATERPELASAIKAYPQLIPDIVKQQIAPSETPFAKLNPKDYTQDSLKTYLQTRNPADLIPREETKELNLTNQRDAYAAEMFGGTPFSKLAPPQMAQVNARIQGEKEREAKILSPSQTPGFKDATDLRKEYQSLPEIKAFKEVQNAFDQINTGLASNTPAGDITAATKFMKLLDPGSVVRESELAIAMGATGLWDRATNYYDMLKRGTKLTAAQREDFRQTAKQLYDAARMRKQESEGLYSDIAQQGGLDPNLVIGSQTSERNLKSRIGNILKDRGAK